MKLKSTEKDANNNITVYLYDLIYTAKESVSKVNKLKYVLSNKTRAIISKLTGIERVEYGRSSINENGEIRRITIHGTPYTSFKFSINKLIDSKADTTIQSTGHYPYKKIVHSVEESILDNSIANSTIDDSTIVNFGGLNMPTNAILTGKLNSKGRYSIVQKFPSITKADYFDSSTPYLGRYSLNINSTFKSGLGGWIKDREVSNYDWSGWYSKILTQKHKILLKIQATIDNVLYTVNDQTIPDGASTQTITNSYVPSRDSGNLVFTYILKPVNAAHAFSSTGFAMSTGRWSNTTASSNGGTIVHFDNFSLTLSTRKITNDTATFKFSINVDKLGTSDVTMAFAINQLVNCS